MGSIFSWAHVVGLGDVWIVENYDILCHMDNPCFLIDATDMMRLLCYSMTNNNITLVFLRKTIMLLKDVPCP